MGKPRKKNQYKVPVYFDTSSVDLSFDESSADESSADESSDVSSGYEL